MANHDSAKGGRPRLAVGTASPNVSRRTDECVQARQDKNYSGVITHKRRSECPKMQLRQPEGTCVGSPLAVLLA